MMNRKKKLDSLPNDLITEIHSRLPAKSITRFRCVSKLWGSLLSGPYFSELFLTRSWARPRILFTLQQDDGLSFYSSPQSQNPYDNSRVVAGFHMKISRDMKPNLGCVASGLIYFSSIKISEKGEETAPVICNPRTGQYAILPKQTRYDINSSSFLGFDPIDKQFKVLFIAYPYVIEHVEILTVGTGKMCWRKIKCGITHNPYFCGGICINGVLYYFAPRIDNTDFDDENYRYRKPSNMIVRFDVRSEKFKFIDIESYYGQLINYKGKLGAVNFRYAGNSIDIEICMRILEDVEKQVWSKYVYSLEEDAVITPYNHSIAGVTTTGEILFLTNDSSKSYYVFYFNPERNTLRKVKIQGFEKYCSVFADVNLIEDLYVNDAKQLKSNQGLNIIRKRPKSY